jgi:hypothetical protein
MNYFGSFKMQKSHKKNLGSIFQSHRNLRKQTTFKSVVERSSPFPTAKQNYGLLVSQGSNTKISGSALKEQKLKIIEICKNLNPSLMHSNSEKNRYKFLKKKNELRFKESVRKRDKIYKKALNRRMRDDGRMEFLERLAKHRKLISGSLQESLRIKMLDRKKARDFYKSQFLEKTKRDYLRNKSICMKSHDRKICNHLK